jgi:UDP-N-acetylglucosamine:LPS N-acetylglucosamine transferase
MKLMAIASIGGHWVELLRLNGAFDEMEVVYVSTTESMGLTVPGHKFYAVPDSNRWDKFKLLTTLSKVYKIVRSEKPDFIISTGAAPGLLALLVGKLLGVKTIWVDSIANVEKLSLSGRIAFKFVDRTYTQWPELATNGIIYAGNVLQ